MGVNIFNLIVILYLTTTIVAIISFILNFKRLDKYFKKQGLQAVFNKNSLVCLIYCFVPVLNIFHGSLLWNGVMWTDEELEEYFNKK